MPKTKLIPVFDGHNDTLLRFFPTRGKAPKQTFFERGRKGHLDMVRARKGGFAGGFFAVFVPNKPRRGQKARMQDYIQADGTLAVPLPPALRADYATRTALDMSAGLFAWERESAGALKVVRDVETLTACLRDDVLAAILHFEGAEPIDPDLKALEVFYQAGLRSLGLVWSRPNAFAEGVPFRFPHTPDTGPGLTEAGRALVKACNQLGILIDLSHLNEAGFWEVAKLSDAPLVATHSNVHAISPSTRNLTDRQLDAIKESDGMVGLNFAVGFLSPEGKPDPALPLEVMVRHIDYLVERVGIDRVGFGSDFDGATIPAAIKDVAGLPKLIDALRAAGYGDGDLRKIAHENWVRVLRKTWK